MKRPCWIYTFFLSFCIASHRSIFVFGILNRFCLGIVPNSVLIFIRCFCQAIILLLICDSIGFFSLAGHNLAFVSLLSPFVCSSCDDSSTFPLITKKWFGKESIIECKNSSIFFFIPHSKKIIERNRSIPLLLSVCSIQNKWLYLRTRTVQIYKHTEGSRLVCLNLVWSSLSHSTSNHVYFLRPK